MVKTKELTDTEEVFKKTYARLYPWMRKEAEKILTEWGTHSLADEDDLVQEGAIGLHKAIKKYDATVGTNFDAYVCQYCYWHMLRAAKETSRAFRLPLHTIERMLEIDKKDDPRQFCHSKDEYNTYLYAWRNPAENISVEDVYPSWFEDETVRVSQKELRAVIETLLDTLAPREAKVLTLYYGLDRGFERTLDDVGRELGVTRERVRQLVAKALRKMRHPCRQKLFFDVLGVEEYLPTTDK